MRNERAHSPLWHRAADAERNPSQECKSRKINRNVNIVHVGAKAGVRLHCALQIQCPARYKKRK